MNGGYVGKGSPDANVKASIPKGLQAIQESLISHRRRICNKCQYVDLSGSEKELLRAASELVQDLTTIIARAPQEYHDRMAEAFMPHWDFARNSNRNLRSAVELLETIEALLSGPFGQGRDADTERTFLMLADAKVNILGQDLAAQRRQGELSSHEIIAREAAIQEERSKLIVRRKQMRDAERALNVCRACGELGHFPVEPECPKKLEAQVKELGIKEDHLLWIAKKCLQESFVWSNHGPLGNAPKLWTSEDGSTWRLVYEEDEDFEDYEKTEPKELPERLQDWEDAVMPPWYVNLETRESTYEDPIVAFYAKLLESKRKG